MRRSARLFAIVEHLRGRRSGITAEALAERFGVTVRTIYRDLDALRDAELPLRADRGRGGGYALERHYTLPPINLTAREAALLVAAGSWAVQMRLLPFGETLDGALDKVRGALSGSAQREMLAWMERLDFVGVPALSAPLRVRRAVEQAWFERQPLRIRYRASNGERTERTIRIRSFLLDRGFTLVDCDDLDKHEGRQLRLDRIESARVIAELAPPTAGRAP